MNKNFIIYLFSVIMTGASVTAVAQRAINHQATEPYEKTQVQAHFRLNVDKGTDTIHFVRDNTDPYIVTKTYVLKHADPYELRPYVRNIVAARKVSQNNTAVECIKMYDGTGLLLVSAEEDRFGKQENGMGLDEIIEMLDQPRITSSAGSTYFMYFPMHRSAKQLQEMIWNVGLTHVNDSYELQRGQDKVSYDSGLNCLLFFISNFSKKNVDEMLQQYDIPIPQALVKYTVYELYSENDGKMGMDFQSWKNNDGADLLSIGGRYRSNWTSTWHGGVEPQTGSNRTEFFNFNPKWNSKYLDFLVSKGYGKVLTTGEVAVKNNELAVIDRTTNIFVPRQTAMENRVLTQYISVTGRITDSKPADATTTFGYYFTAKDSVGRSVTVSGNDLNGSISAVKMIPQGQASATRYQLAVEGGTLQTSAGGDFGSQMDNLSSFTIYRRSVDSSGNVIWTAMAWTDDITIHKAYELNTAAGPGFGFRMHVTPTISAESSILNVKVTNNSLIGWQSSGEPRLTRNSEIVADIMISNEYNRFVIGGIEKQTMVRSVGGIPWLREIPGLGWLFATESESTKKSQLVVVGECILSPINRKLSPEMDEERKKIADNLQNAGVKNRWGFDQYGIDK